MNQIREDIKFHQCDCGDEDHVIFTDILIWEGEPDMDEFIVGVQLAPLNSWYRRVWVALKYIVNPHGKYSHWHSSDISDPTAIRDHINEYLNRHIDNETNQKLGAAGYSDFLLKYRNKETTK